MGCGDYCYVTHTTITSARSSAPKQEVFRQHETHPLMKPHGVRVRESRDSASHPNSLGIAFVLDVTGSMGSIPNVMATKYLPSFMKVLLDCRVDDPQILFAAVGDASCDHSPLQIGQFESAAELMDDWLTRLYLEGGGGNPGMESYELALYFMAQHTEMDCWVKRKKRGYLFVTGDENPYPLLSKHGVESVIGDRLDDDIRVEEIVAEVCKTFNVHFIIPDHDRRKQCENKWRSLLGDNVLCMSEPRDICFVSAGALLISEGIAKDMASLLTILCNADMPKSRAYSVQSALGGYLETHVG